MAIKLNDGIATIIFHVVGYEFEYDKVEDTYDRNWLNIGVRYYDSNGKHSCIDPFLLTWELETMADRLRDVASGEETHYDSDDTFDILESNLHVIIKPARNGLHRLKVEFYHEGKLGKDVGGVTVTQLLSDAELLEMAAEIDRAVEMFPQRD